MRRAAWARYQRTRHMRYTPLVAPHSTVVHSTGSDQPRRVGGAKAPGVSAWWSCARPRTAGFTHQTRRPCSTHLTRDWKLC
jgi:hypothetical protein